jgi:site-specific recombinase XerD
MFRAIKMNLLTFDNTQLSQPKTEAEASAILQPTANGTAVTLATSEYLHAAISNNTRRAYCSDLAHFIKWGGTIPASPETVTAYITEHAGIVKSTTLVRRLVSIRRAHSSQGLANPCKSDLCKTTLRGIKRVHGMAARQAAPAVREDILAMVRGLVGLKGTRDRALLLLGFAGAFRRSELVGLDVADLEFVDRGLIVKLRRSKTDQEGTGRKIAIPYARGPSGAHGAPRERRYLTPL